MSTEWLLEFESTIKRLNKAEKSIKKEIMNLSKECDKEIKKKLDLDMYNLQKVLKKCMVNMFG